MAFDPTTAFLDDDNGSASPAKSPVFDASSAMEDADADQGVLGTLKEGAKSAGRALGSTVNTYTGNGEAVVEKAKAQQEAPRDYRLDNFYRDVEQNTQSQGEEDPGVWDAVKGVGKAVIDNPAGAGLAVLEQLPNSVPTMAGGWAGMKGGAALGAAAGGPVGAGVGGLLGGLAGMFLGNAAIETGHKAMGAAGDGEYTPEEMDQVKREGAIKGGVITAVDAATLGLGGKVAGAMQRTTATALEAATRKALVDQGIDVADEAAVLAARSNPQVSAAVRQAQQNAVKATDTLQRRAAEAGTLLAMESAGEGIGEYLGELAATGEGNVTDAVLESLLSLGQSGAETAWNMTRKRDEHGVWDAATAAEEPASEAAPAAETAPDLVQPEPTPENPAPAPVPRPNPADGALSAAASLLPSAQPVPVAPDASQSTQAAATPVPPQVPAGPLSSAAARVLPAPLPAAAQAEQPVAPVMEPAANQATEQPAPDAEQRPRAEQPATPSQRAILKRRGIADEQLASMTRQQAGELIQQQNKTQAAGAPKPQQLDLQDPAQVEADLREQLRFLERQARSAGGWTPALSRERAKLRTALEPFDAKAQVRQAEIDAGMQAMKTRAEDHQARVQGQDPIRGQDIDGDWMTFAEQSGTKQVPRAQMPQIKAEHRGAMVNFLNARGIEHQEETVPAASLKPTQGEFSRKKVEQAKAYTGGSRSILVSSDNHVLDGHHQWLAAREAGDDVKVIRLGAPIDELLTAAHEFPSSTTDDAAPVDQMPIKDESPAIAGEPAPVAADEQISKTEADAAQPGQPATPDAQPAEAAPVKWFASKSKAEAHIAKKKLGDTHQVVKNGNKYEIRQLEQQKGDLIVQQAPPVGPTSEPAQANNGQEQAPGKAPTDSTAPEHRMVGVDDRELAQIVAEFNAAQAEMQTGDEQVHHLFDAPAKGEVVRLQDRVKVYNKEHGWMTPAEAKARIAEWKERARTQGDKNRIENSQRVVLSLFDLTGSWSRPWEEAGYQVYRFDIQDDPEVGDVNNFSSEFFSDWFGDFEGQDIYAILAACPCTDFAVSGARHFAAKDKDGRTVASVSLVHQTLRTIEHFRPAVWAIENPVGRIEKLGGLPPWRLSFDPNHLGDPYTKKTLLWGRFNGELPIAPVEPTEGSKMHKLYGGKSLATKNARSATPEGFAYGFFLANNAIDNPVMAIANKYDRLDRKLIGEAVDAGMTEDQIGEVIDDLYYMDLDDEGAEAALREAIPTEPEPGNKAEPQPKVQTDAVAAPKAKTKDTDRFAGNTLFTADRVAAARARLKSKMGQLNSGIDPEILVDGMTIAGAYIESGVRNFAEYAAMMTEDFGDKIKPYLLSFWEGARNYPGLDTDGMTSAEEAATLHAALNRELPAEEAPALGSEVKKPAKRAKKNGTKGDTTLTQDWGVDHIDGYSDNYERETGNAVKDQFLKDAAKYLGAVADLLREAGYVAHPDRKGNPQRPVSKNEAGDAVSGEVTLTLRDANRGVNVYVQVGGTSLRGVVPTTPSGVSILYRVSTQPNDQYATRNSTNRWAPTDLSAADLAAIILKEAKGQAPAMARPAVETTRDDDERTQPRVDQADPAGVPEPAGGRGRDSQPGSAQADTGGVAPAQPENVGEPVAAGAGDATGLRPAAADVAGGSSPAPAGDAGNGRARAGRAKSPDAGAGAGRRAERDRTPSVTPTKNPAEVSPANPGAGNFHIADPLKIVGGGQVARFEKNRAAIELYNQLRAEGRPATRAEQEVLAGYTGWGSFGQELFQGSWTRPAPKQGWEARDEWLRENLGQAEWEGLQRSITNAHYTDPPTVLAMWDMVRRMGFVGGRVLEPSMGIGNFYGMMPAELKARSQLAGIELDPVTGGMAQLLYPDANVQIKGYQDSKTPADFYDLVIGNWPFENTVVADRNYQRLSPYLHDYFFLKALDQTRPGGLVVGITSKGTMDKKAIGIRAELAKKGELVAAFRLPSGAFEEYAGTKVVTDIVILRKRDEPVRDIADAGWIEAVDYKTPSGETVSINEYYVANPQNVIGTIDFGHGTTFRRPGMIVHRPDNMAEQLKRIVDLVPEGVFQPARQAQNISYVTNHTSDRENALVRTADGFFVVRGEYLAPAQEVAKYQVKSEATTRKREDQFARLIDMRKQYAALIEAQRGGEAKAERKALKASYDAFVAEHGRLNESYGLSYLEKVDDPFYAALAALEVHENGQFRPSSILSRATTRSALAIDSPSVADAFVLARNKAVNPTLEQIAEIAKKPANEVRRELLDRGAVFELPSGDIVPADMYLSGNVREKLRDAKAAVAEGLTQMQRNVDALEKVVPADVPYYKIEAQMGASWVSTGIYAEYVAHMLNLASPEGIDVAYSGGRWRIKLPAGANNRPEASAGFGTPEVPFSRLVNAAISNQTINVKRRDSDGNEYIDGEATKEVNNKIAEIRQRFGEWLWSDPERRSQVEREYNDARNAYATPRFDGSVLAFEGMALSLGNGPFDLRQHQRNAIWRALVTRRSLNAHEVGTGKTFTMGGIAVESRRYGIAKKPLLLAHNANSKTVAAEIQMMYPAAKVLYIDNLAPASVDIRLRQIANDDWDVVVLPHSLINRLAFKEETLMAMAYEEIAELESAAAEAAAEDGVTLTAEMLKDEQELAKLRSVTAKDLVKMRNRIINTIKAQAQRASKDGAIPFEDLGIDMVLVDEAHEFKKPPFTTKMKMKGLQTQSSDRSIALAFLTKYIRTQNNGGNVHLFTGTPITNTLTEVFHQMRYIMQEEMEAAGVDQWDGWFGSFAREVTDVELSASAEYEAVTRLAAFINVPELRRMIGQYMDVVFAEDMPEMQPRRTTSGKTLDDETLTEAERVELLNGRTEQAKDRPYKKVIVDTADLTADQKVEFAKIQGYARAWRNMDGKARKQAMAAGDPESPIIYENLAGKASFDVRLNHGAELAGKEGQVPDDPNSKASRVIRNVLEVYNSHPLATQVIFTQQGLSDTATRSVGPSGDKKRITFKTFSTVKDMIERMVQQGIPREQIAVVDGSTSKDKRKEIADAMNRAEIRVVIGSTQSLGVGVNMQRNLRAMHHMDAPWMPGDLEQRNGRGHRQGNQWNTVFEYRYLTDRLDGRRWQVLAIKQRFINAFLKANDADRVIEGDAASDEESDILETFAEAAGDPRILIREKLKKKIEQLQSRERLHGQAVLDARRSARVTRERRDSLRDKLEQLDQAGVVEAVQALTSATMGANFTMTVDGAEYDNRKDAEAALAAFASENVRAGDKRQHAAGSFGGHPVSVSWEPFADQPIITVTIKGTPISSRSMRLQSLETALRGYPDEVQKLRDQTVEAARTITRLEQVAGEPFHMAADLERVKKDYDALEQDLADNPVPPPAWLRSGAPVDTEVMWNGKPFLVSGHRWSDAGWFVLASDAKGSVAIPYSEARDAQGMPVYEERSFEAPQVIEQSDPEPAGQSSYRLANRAAKGIALFSARGIAKKGALAGLRVEVVATEAELPAHVRADILADGVSGRIAGVHNGGVSYLIANRLQDTQHAVSLVLHEAVGHGGVQAVLGERFAPTMREIYRSIPAAVRRELQERYASQIANLDSEAAQVLVAEEYVAHLAETNPQHSIVSRVVALLRKAIRALFGERVAMAWTHADLVQLLREARRAATTGTGPQGEGARYRDQGEALAPLPEVSEVDESEFVESLSGGAERAFAGAIYRARGTDSPFFRRWFGESKMRTKDGQPIAFYHRSYGERDNFDDARLGGNTGTPAAALGHYLARRDVGNVERYGPVTERFYVRMVKPKVVSQAEFEAMGDWSVEQAKAYRKRLMGEGFDGLYIAGLGWPVVFEGKNIKAVRNTGTFDETDRTRYAVGETIAQQFDHTARAYGGREAWQAARDAGRTKLDYQQWVEVRTPAYKALHGNWEGLRAQQRLDQMKPVVVRVPEQWRGKSEAEMRALMLESLDAMVRSQETIDHAEVGQIRVGRKGAKKTLASSKDPAKMLVSNDLRAVLPQAFLARAAAPSKSDGPDVDGYSTLLARVDVDGVSLVAAFTLRHQSDGAWYYNSVTLHDARNERAQDSYGRPDRDAGSRFAPIAGLESFVRRALDRVNPESVSVELDAATGEPVIQGGQSRYRLIGRQEPIELTVRNAKRSLKGRLADLKPTMLGALPLMYLRDFAPKTMTALDAYMDEKRAMDADRNEMHTRYDAIAQRWLKLRWTDRKAEQRLADLMHAATLAGVDPSRPAKDSYTDEQKAEYNRLRLVFNSLPEGHRAMFGEARDAYKAQVSTLEQVIEDNIRKSADYAIKRARRDRDADVEQARDELTGDELDEAIEDAERRYQRRVAAAQSGNSAKLLLLRKKFESMRVDEPYFPLKRFGDYFVALRDGTKLVSFSMFEKASDMEAAAAELRKTYPGLEVSTGRKSIKQELAGAVDPGFVADLQELVARLPNGEEVSEQMWQMYLETLPDYSMRKGFIHRKKVPGFDRDAMRAFASSMFHSSYQIARLKHSLEMNELVEQVEDQAKASADPVDAMTIANELRKRHEWVMAPKGGKVAQTITSAAFVYQLGITPAAALVNMTQTWMMGIPVLGTRFGSEAKATAALSKASADFVKGKGHLEKTLQGDEAAAFAEFMRMGLIDKTQAHDLAGVGETGVEYNPVRHKVMGYISWAFHNAERYNREVTVMAAYRMAREAGLDHAAAIKESAELTWTTHFDYSSGNRARFMQSDTAKVLLVFRQHSINMLSRLTIDLKNAIKGESPQVKKAAKRRLAGIFVMFALFAGAMGLPGMTALLALLDLFDDDDDPWSAEDKIKRTITETVGPDVARVMLGGVPGALLDVDLTNRIGMGSLWFWSPNRELEGQDAYYYWMEQALGAAPAMIGNAFTGMSMIGQGHVWRGIETMMPKAVKDAMRSGRYAQEGVQTMAGDALVDDVSTWGVLAQAMGFTPAHIAERYESNSALKSAEQRIKSERRSILNRYAMAVRAGDEDAKRGMLERIGAFNRRYPQVSITGRTIALSMKARAQRDARTVGGLALDSRLEFLRNDL